MAAAATEADIPPLSTETKNEGDRNVVDEATIDSISKLAQIHVNEPLTFEGDNFLITPSVCEVQKQEQAAEDDLKSGNDQTLDLVSDKECNKTKDQNVKENRGRDETEAATKGECPSNQNITSSEQVKEDNETTENASDNSREDNVRGDDSHSKEIEKSTEELQLTQGIDGSPTERDQQPEKENDVSTEKGSSLISDTRDEHDNLQKVEPFETENNSNTEEVQVEKSIESLHEAPYSGHDSRATSSSEEQIIGAEQTMDDYTPKELQQNVAVSATNEDKDNNLLSQVGAHLEQEKISSNKTEEEIAEVAGAKEECTEDVATCVVNQNSSLAEDGSPKPSEELVSTFKDRVHDSAHALEDKFEDENSQKAELVETEKFTEKLLMEDSGDKEIPTKDAHEISTDITKKEIDEVAATEDVTAVSIQKEVSTSNPIDHEQPANTPEDESSLKVESVEKLKCTEKEMEISSAEALTEKEIQTTKSDATKDEITEVADVRTQSAEAEIEDESSPIADSIENEKCIDKEMEIQSMHTSSEKEIPTANLQEISSEATKDEGDEVPNSMEETIKDVAMNIPNPENRDIQQVAEDETQFSACRVTENEAVNTVEAKFEIESSLKAEVFENKECTKKTTDISDTEEASSEKEIQAENSHELLSDKTKEEIDEVFDVNTKDITTNFPNQENEEVSTSKARETEQPTNTFEDESSLKVELVKKENCTEEEMENSSREVSSEKEIESIESDRTKEGTTVVADIGEESTKDIETNFLNRENKDTSAVEEDRSQKTEKDVSDCKASADHEPTNSIEAKIEGENPTKAELVKNEKCIEKEISSTEVLTQKNIPTANPQEISTDATKKESDEVAGLTEECIKDVATDDANKENEDTLQDDASQKPSHKEVPTSKASDHDSENTLDAKFEDKNSLKRELDENEKCTEKEMEVSLTEPSSEKEIPTAYLQEILIGKTEEEIYKAADTKDITTHVLDQENEDNSLVAEDHLQKPSQNEISTSKATDQEKTNTLENESSLKAESVEKEECPEKEIEISSTELSSEKEIQTTGSDETREKITEVADIRKDGTNAKIEEESSLKAEMVENEKCIDKDMEISSAEASTEKGVQMENLQEISGGITEEASDKTADPQEESMKGEAINILNQENEDTSLIAKDGKDDSMSSVSEKAGNTLEVKFEDESSLKAEVTKNEECTEYTMEILPKEDSSEKEAQTVDSLEISTEKTKEETGKVADTKEESTEDLLAEEGSQKPSQKEDLTSNVHDHEPTNTHDAQLDDESSQNAEWIEDEKCTEEEMDKPSTEASSEKQIQTADPQEASSDKTKEEINEVADLKEESIKDVPVTAPNQENKGTLPIVEESSERPCLEEVSTCKFSDNVVRNAVTDKFPDESYVKPKLVENEKSTEKHLVEEETPIESVYAADKDIKALDSRPNKEISFLEEEKAIEHNTEDKAHNAATEMVETCDDEDVETDIPHENANEKPPSQVHSSWMETETSTREITASTSVTEGAQADIKEEKNTEANAEGEKGIIPSDKDNEQIPSFEDDSQKPSLEGASAGNTDDDKSTIAQDAKYAEEDTTEHTLNKDEKDVECNLGTEELSIESLQVSKDFEGIDTVKTTETETNHPEEQSVAKNTQGIIRELEEVKTIDATVLNAETPDVDKQGHKVDKTMHASDSKADTPEEKDVAPMVTQEDTKESFPNQVNALETSKEPETKSVEEQIITSNLQEISIVKTMEETSDTTSVNKETLDKQEAKLEDKETITAEFNERSIDESLVMKELMESLQVAVKDDVECDSGQDSEKSRSLQEETLEANHENIPYDNKEDENTNKMELTIETPGSENIAAVNDEKSATVAGAKYVEHDLSTHEKDMECTSGKEEASIELLQEASEDIKAAGSVKETDANYLEEQGIVTNTQGIISVLEEDKIIGASDLNAGKPEDKDVATMVPHKDAEENLPTELDAKQYTHLEKVAENPSNVELLTQYTTESTLVKEESQVKDIELSNPCQEPEAKSVEEKIVTSNLQEYPIAQTEEEASHTASMTREVLDEREIKFEDKDTITAKFNERSTDVALATEESQVEDTKLSTQCEEAEAKSVEEQIVTSNLQEIPIAKIEEETSDTKSMTRETLDEQETKFEDKGTITSELNERSTDEALAVKDESIEPLQVLAKDVVAYDAGQESEKSSSLQEEIPEASHEKFIYDNKDVEKTEKMESTTETPDTKDVTTILQEVTCETSISQMDLSQKEHENPSFTELPKEDTTMLKEEAEVQCIDSLQDKEASPVKDQISDADSLNTLCATTEEKIIIHETHALQEGLEVKDNITEKTDFKVSEVADDTSKKCEEQLEEDDTMKSLLGDETHAENGQDKRECKQEKILSDEIKDIQESTATATLVAHDSTLGMELTIDEKQQSEGKDEDAEHHHLDSCKEEITMEKQQVEEATQETRENIDNVNEGEEIPKVSDGGSRENAREPQEDLPANEPLDRSFHQNHEEKNIEEVTALVDTEDTNQADNSYAEIRTEDLTKNEEANMGEICESKKDMDITGKVSKVMEEAVKEPEEHSLAKETIDESLEQEKLGNNVTQVASILDAENAYGTDNLHTKTNQEEISEIKEITNDTKKESKVSEEAVQEPEEILLANADKSLNQKGVTSSTEGAATIVHAERSYGEEDAQRQETKTEDSREDTIIESSPEHDVKPKEIILEEICEVKEKENENEAEKVFSVFEATVENEPDKSIPEVTTIVDTEEIHQVNHANIERKFEDSREVIAKDEVMQEETKTGEICNAKELEIETVKEPKVSEEVIQDPEKDTEAIESTDKSAVQGEPEKSIKEHVEVEEAHRIDPAVHTETNIEKPIKTEGYIECEVNQQEIIEKEICEVQKTADETMKEPKTIEEDSIQEPEEDSKTDKYFDGSPYEVNQQEINEKEMCEVKTFPDEASKVVFHGVAETAVQESEENIHASVAESHQQKEPEKCVQQVSEVSQEDSEQKTPELEEKFPTNVIRSLPQKEHDVRVEEVATILDTKEICHGSADLHTEARGEDLREKETENHPVDSETKSVSSDFEKVDDKAAQAVEETQKGIGVVTTALDTSETGFEESKEENNLETVAEKDVEHLGKETEVTTATPDTEKHNKNITYDPVPTQAVYRAIEHAEDKNENSDAIKEETYQKLDQKDSTGNSNELEVKEEESPLFTETKGEDDDKNTFNNKEESANSPKSKDSEKPSLSALFQSSARETVQTADDQVTSKECAVQIDSQQQAEQNDDDPAKSQEKKVSDEESNEKRSSDIVAYEAPVMVDAVADTEAKTAHKKSHNLLSGVGSKVKHSISKVKKAITGKSSNHPKSSSPH